MLTCKERLRKAIFYEQIDNFPTQINYTGRMGTKLANYYNLEINELHNFFNNHMIRIDISYPVKLDDARRIKFDWWGVGFDTKEEGYYVSLNPIECSENIEDYHWPDPNQERLFDEAAKVIKNDNGEHFITCNMGFCLFERAWALRGFQNFLLDMAVEPAFAEYLLERITEIQLVLIQHFISLGVDGGYFGDDYGSQKNLLFSPDTWRKMIKPRLSRMFAPFREAGLPIIMHSDGNIAEILPDLVDIGLTTLNPVQPEVLSHAWLKKTFGTNLSYYGGISTQTVLPHGTLEEVELAVLNCKKILASEESGVILAPSHRMMSDIPLKNVEALRNSFMS